MDEENERISKKYYELLNVLFYGSDETYWSPGGRPSINFNCNAIKHWLYINEPEAMARWTVLQFMKLRDEEEKVDE